MWTPCTEAEKHHGSAKIHSVSRFPSTLEKQKCDLSAWGLKYSDLKDPTRTFFLAAGRTVKPMHAFRQKSI